MALTSRFFLLPSAFAFVIAIGCSSIPERFYEENFDAMQVTEPCIDAPRMFVSPNLSEDIQFYERENYKAIGKTAFVSTEVSDREFLSLAESKGAAIALLRKQYIGTESGIRPLTIPTVTTSTVLTSGTISNLDGGLGTYSGTAQVTTYGSQTLLIPYSNSYYEYCCVLLRKRMSKEELEKKRMSKGSECRFGIPSEYNLVDLSAVKCTGKDIALHLDKKAKPVMVSIAISVPSGNSFSCILRGPVELASGKQVMLSDLEIGKWNNEVVHHIGLCVADENSRRIAVEIVENQVNVVIAR